MNRFVRAIVSSASIIGGLAAVPAVAQAHPVNVAPPADAPPYLPYGQYAPAPPVPQVAAYPGAYRSNAHGTAYEQPYDRHVQWQDGRRDHERNRSDRAERMRECVRAYASGAPRWVLQRMSCPAY